MTRAWLLPEQIADVLPSQARRVEGWRRTLIDRAGGYGYELVQPPLIEQFLLEQRKRDLVAQHMKDKRAAAHIQYVGKYAASAPAAAALPPSLGASGPVDNSEVARGLGK